MFLRKTYLLVGGLTLLALWFLSGCALPPAPADAHANGRGVYLPLLNAESVTVQLITVNAAELPAGSFEAAVTDFEKYLSGNVNIVEPKSVRVADNDTSVNEQQVEDIVKNYGGLGSTIINVVVAPNLDSSWFKGRGFYRHNLINDQQDQHHIYINADVTNVSADKIPLMSRKKFWRIVMLHELCHSLGVPASPSHSWKKGHCTHPECILYPSVDRRSVLTSILRLGPPLKLCCVCKNEIRQRK